MKYGVFGAGAVGTYLGARLATAGAQVSLLGRAGFAKAVQENAGITIRGFSGKDHTLNLCVHTQVEALKNSQIILLTVKSPDTKSAMEALLPVLAEDTVIISLQNGIRNPEIIADFVGKERVAAGTVTFNILAQNTLFHQTLAGPVIVGRPEAAPHRADDLVSDLRVANIDAFVKDDMTPILWGKLLLNLGNALSALTDLPILAYTSHPDSRAVYRAAIDEGLSLLKKANISPAKIGRRDPRFVRFMLSLPFPPWLTNILVRRLYRITPEARSSTWYDLTKGKKTEIDFLNGELVHFARKHQTSAPINEKLWSLVKEAERQGKSPKLSPEKLRKLVGV